MRKTAAIGALLVGVTACSHRGRPQAVHTIKAHRPQAVAIAMDRQVHNALDAGEGDLVIRALRQKVAAEPDNAAARLELAQQYQKQGAYELAIDHLRIAASRIPDSEEASTRLSRALRANEQTVEAIAVLVKFSDAHAGASAALLEELAMLEDETGAFGEGERFHRRAIAADLKDDTLRNNLGYNFLQQGKYEDAAHEFRAALQLNAASETARNNLGFAMARLGKGDEAILQWSSISGPAAAHNNLAAVWIEQGKLAEARQEIQTALEYDRHNSAALRNLRLVSELDGKAPSFTMKSDVAPQRNAQAWGKLTSALGRFFRGSSSGSTGRTMTTAQQQAAADRR